jgi:hypothetical protein
MTISKRRLLLLLLLPRRRREFVSNFRRLLRTLKASPHHPMKSPSPSTSHRESNMPAHLKAPPPPASLLQKASNNRIKETMKVIICPTKILRPVASHKIS